MNRITESESKYDNLDIKSTAELIREINQEDKTVPQAIEKCLDQIEALINAALENMKKGGRLFYIGAGTSGRLGIVDASECPPTFGVPHGLVVGLMAGGDKAMRKAVEFAEDSAEMAWDDLKEHQLNETDFLIGIAASGTTPYVIGGLKKANENGIKTGCIVCNPGSPVAAEAAFPIECITGPEYVTGSTRMKAGTAQKLILNMISTSLMIQLGRVKGNRMVDMQLSNNKLVDRGTQMVMNELNIEYDRAQKLLLEHGSVRAAIDSQA
jgi:N-acetylmuramic acid 6-phosphate etherase